MLFSVWRWFNYEKMCLTLPSTSKTTFLAKFFHPAPHKLLSLFEPTDDIIYIEELQANKVFGTKIDFVLDCGTSFAANGEIERWT